MRMVAGETPGWETHNVYLNGKLPRRCVLADEEQGIAECMVTDENGQVIPLPDGNVEMETRRGTVEIRAPHLQVNSP